MNAKWYISTLPATDPITEAELEAALRLSSGFDNATISRLVPASARQVETDTDRSLITRTITGKLDHWPTEGVIHLPKPPFISVTSVKYFDTNGAEQTLVENTDYEVKVTGDSGRIVVAPSVSWPSVKSDKKEVIEIVYQAGYGDASAVPDDLKEACIKWGVWAYSNGAIDDFLYKKMVFLRKNFFNYNKND